MRNLIILLSLLLCFSSTAIAQETTDEPDPNEGTLVPRLRPEPTTSFIVDGVTLQLLFDRLPQGRVGVLYVTGDNLVEVRLRYMDQLTDFVQTEDGFYGFLAVNMDQSPRIYDFSVFAWLEDGTRLTLPAQVDVTLGGFIRQPDLTVPPDRAHLIDPEVERNELARLFSVFEAFTPEKHWETDGFQPPVESELTSPFGAFRTFNQSVQSRHTGWDMRAPVGTPVKSIADGRVAYAGILEIRGNHVIIDHGYGVFSGYSHLSQVHVTRGQTIVAGQIIGVSGNTGRSGGAHLHWEMAVNGQWVDSVDFLNTWMP